ncbi:hypothetical protein KHP62_06550 [Rhodobacteraceae bacterium NNCM2]|nr:hypothetical protein [Coraliihabitans acroporae]
MALLAALPAQGADVEPEHLEFYGNLEVEGTGFFDAPQFSQQVRDDASVAGTVTVLAEWLDGDLRFRLTPFARLDSADDKRTHADLREAKIDYTPGRWSFTIGADKVFWGKTEVVHLVNIINQTDLVESRVDLEYLGQPLVKAAYLSDIGEFSAFAMPYFRERTFPGAAGRLRFSTPVDTDEPIYETDAEEWTPSFAVRYSGVIGDVDLGLSAFHGLSRDPSFVFDGPRLLPVYSPINQGGLDVQYTSGATLWKFESIYRTGQRNLSGVLENYFAATGGLEHTLYGIFGSDADLGLIGEYAYDQRGEQALNAFDNDIILGTRLTLNDTQNTAMLFTSAFDADDGAVGLRFEADRRIGENFKVAIEAQAFLNTDGNPVQRDFAKDSYIRTKLLWFF